MTMSNTWFWLIKYFQETDTFELLTLRYSLVGLKHGYFMTVSHGYCHTDHSGVFSVLKFNDCSSKTMTYWCLKCKPIRGKKLLCVVLLVAKVVASLLVWVLASTHPLATQILDVLGVPSTFYMGDVSCDHCNSFNPVFIIEPRPEPSALQPVFLLNLVFSHLDNIQQRQAIRQTWGSVRDYDGNQIRTFFCVGRCAI